MTVPKDPPPGTEDIEFDPLDPEFYEDFKDAKLAGQPIEVTWETGPPATVKATAFV